MLNFFRRSKTKDNIEYNKNDTQKEKFKQLSSLDDSTIVLTSNASTSKNNVDKNKSGKVAPQHTNEKHRIYAESGKQQRSTTTLTSLTPTLLNDVHHTIGGGEGNVICNSPPSSGGSTSTIIQQPKDRRIIGHKPYVANICDLVYLTNDNQQQQQNKKISGAFKDIMAPAMGWRNKNKNNNSKKGKNKQQNTSTTTTTTHAQSTSTSSNAVANQPTTTTDMGNNNSGIIPGTQTNNKSENNTVQQQENKINKNSVQLKQQNNNINSSEEDGIKKQLPHNTNNENVTKSQVSSNDQTTSLERPIKPPRVEKTNSILRTPSQEHKNSNTSLQQQQPHHIAIIGNTANDLKHQSSNANVSNQILQSNINKSILLNDDDTTEIFLPAENNLNTKLESKLLNKQNSSDNIEKKSQPAIVNITNNVPKLNNTENSNIKNVKQNEKNLNSNVKLQNQSSLNNDSKISNQSNKMGNQQTSTNAQLEPNKAQSIGPTASKITNEKVENSSNKMKNNPPNLQPELNKVQPVKQSPKNEIKKVENSNQFNKVINQPSSLPPEINKVQSVIPPSKTELTKIQNESKNIENVSKNKVETVPSKIVQKTSNLEHFPGQKVVNLEKPLVKVDVKNVTNSNMETSNNSILPKENNIGNAIENSSNLKSNENKKTVLQPTNPQNEIKIDKNLVKPVQNSITNQTNHTVDQIQTHTDIKQSAQKPKDNDVVVNDKLNINDHTINKINNDNKQHERRLVTPVSTSTQPQLQNTKSIESNDITTPPLVCSIAIPLPPKILKSDKIPVTAIIERRLSADKINESNQGHHKITVETDKTKNLVSQEARFQSQIAELKKQLTNRDAEALKFTCEMEELQRDIYVKSSGMDRLQAELISANKESEHVRKRLRHLEDDLQIFRDKNSELADELTKKSDEIKELKELNEKHALELEDQVKVLTNKIHVLESQNEKFKQERDRLEQQRSALEKEREEEKKIVQEALEMAMSEKKSIQERWEKDFEKLRTVNTGREQQLLDDFEWKLREVEQSCKRRIEEKDKIHEEKLKEAYKGIDEKVKNADAQLNEVLHLKSYEAEVKQLRGLTDDQQRSLRLVSQRTEELQLSEETLKEEIEKLKIQIEIEKGKLVNIQHQHQYELTEKDRELQIKFEVQKGEVAVQWEERLHQECSRLKSELEQMHVEEKTFAVEAIKNKMKSEHNQAKKVWEHQMEECTLEITNLKKEMVSKEESYQNELERLQTKADRDILELRRSLDKTDMAYNNQIEKLTESHEREIERLTDEYEKKIKDLEANWQMQMTSTRTTLELVKEQMERDAQDKLQSLDQHHRSQLEHQWEQLVQDKEEALQQMEQNYRGNCDKLKDEMSNLQKSHAEKENELLTTIDELKTQIDDKTLQINCLQSNVDTLQGGMHVLNREIKNHEGELNKMQKDNEKKIRRVRDELLAEQTRRLNHQKEQQSMEMEKFQKTTKDYIDNLQKKCQCWSKLFEEMRTKYQQNQCHEDQTKVIAELKQVISKQENELTKLMEEKNNYKVQLGQKIPKEFRRKGGGATLSNNPSPELDKNVENSQILTTPNRELDVIWETNDNNEELQNRSTQESN